MARHRVIPFDDVRLKAPPRSIRHTHPKYPAIQKRIWQTYMYTLLGYGAMGLLCAIAFWGFGFSLSLDSLLQIIGWGSIFWFGFPILLWWNCTKLALAIQRATPANPKNPAHARVQACVDRVYAHSGLKFKPPLYYSPLEMPNAFATGPIHRKAVVAFTEGLLKINLTDDEIEAIFAHELAHVKNYDVGINSLLAVLSVFFFLIVSAGAAVVVTSYGFLKDVLGAPSASKGGWLWNLVTGLLYNIFVLPVYLLCSQLTRFIQMFVVRSRESAADATGCFMTGEPCALASALTKLVNFAEKNRPKPGSQDFAFFQVFRPIMTIDPLFDSKDPPPAPVSVWQRLKAFWVYIQLTHPPVSERVYHLERMNGGSCTKGS